MNDYDTDAEDEDQNLEEENEGCEYQFRDQKTANIPSLLMQGARVFITMAKG
jgi:hypothetical protein